MDLHLRTLPVSSDPSHRPGVRAWMRAVHLGFHMPDPTDDLLDHWMREVIAEKSRLRGMYDADSDGLRENDDPVATLLSFDKTVSFGDDVLVPMNAVTDVTVRASHRRRGILRTMLSAELEDTHRRGIPLAALTVTESGIYRRFGFGPAVQSQRTEIRTVRSFEISVPVPGRMEQVGRAVYRDHVGTIFDRFHATTPGSVSRSGAVVDFFTGAVDHDTGRPDPHVRHALHLAEDGTPDGALTWKVDQGTPGGDATATVYDFVAPTAPVSLALWNFLGHIDLVTSVRRRRTPVDDPLPYALSEPDVYQVTGRSDFLWLRVLDVAAVLTARRYLTDGDVTVRVIDDMGFADGTYRLVVREGTPTVDRVSDEPDVVLDVAALGSSLLGGISVSTLAAAGRISGSGTAALARLLLTGRAPVSVTPF